MDRDRNAADTGAAERQGGVAGAAVNGEPLPLNTVEPIGAFRSPDPKEPSGVQVVPLGVSRVVAQVTFSKRREGVDAQLKTDVRGKDEAGKTVFVRRDLDLESLKALMGPDNTQRIVQSRQRGGTLMGDRLAPMPDDVPAQKKVAEHSRHDRDDGGKTGSMGSTAPAGAAGSQDSKGQQQVELDRRADQALREHQLKAELAERYVQRDGEYRFRAEPAKVAFVDQGAKLITQLATPSIARSMLDLAEAKGWITLRVRGDETFRRQVWLEAGLRDMKVLGYEATAHDQALLQSERAARQVNMIEPTVERKRAEPQARNASPWRDQPHQPPRTAGASGLERRDPDDSKRQVLAVLQAALKVERVDQRTALSVLQRAEERLDQLVASGRQLPQVRVYARQAPREASMAVQVPRAVRERSARGR